ncbi:MAG: hypothetical protein U1F61_28345 [Opitutaceae bacterium]
MIAASVWAQVAVAATVSETDVITAVQALHAAANYTWKRTIERTFDAPAQKTGGDSGKLASETLLWGKSSRDGVTVAKFSQDSVNQKAMLNGVFTATRGLVDYGAGWMTREEVLKAFGWDEPTLSRNPDWKATVNSRRELLTRAHPGSRFALQFLRFGAVSSSEQLRDLLPEMTSLRTDGDAIVAELTQPMTDKLLEEAAAETLNPMIAVSPYTALSPQVRGGQATVKFWLKYGGLQKFELRIRGEYHLVWGDRSVARATAAGRSPAWRSIEYTATTEFFEPGKSEFSLSTNAIRKLKGDAPQEVSP